MVGRGEYFHVYAYLCEQFAHGGRVHTGHFAELAYPVFQWLHAALNLAVEVVYLRLYVTDARVTAQNCP